MTCCPKNLFADDPALHHGRIPNTDDFMQRCEDAFHQRGAASVAGYNLHQQITSIIILSIYNHLSDEV